MYDPNQAHPCNANQTLGFWEKYPADIEIDFFEKYPCWKLTYAKDIHETVSTFTCILLYYYSPLNYRSELTNFRMFSFCGKFEFA